MTQPSSNDNNINQEHTFVSHLIELRSRLIRTILFVLLVFMALLYFANDIYSFLATPLFKHLPSGSNMIATEVASPFLAPFKLTVYTAIFVSMPYLIYQLWAFIAPGLYINEKRFVMPLLYSSILLFYVGIVFAYFIVLPLLFSFFTTVAPEGVTVMTDISRYLDFVLKIFFAFGLAFEVPIATMLVVWAGLTTVESLKNNRPYIIVSAFVIGMLLTPPDIISQILLAVPIWGLFELGLLLSSKLAHENTGDEL